MSFFETASLVLISDFAAASASAVSGSGTNTGKAYSVKPTDGSGDFDFERGSDITATRVNKDGYIEKGRGNFLLQSNQFDTTWTTLNTSITSGQSGYDGSSDAWLLSKSAANGFVYQNISSSPSGIQSISVYAKKGTNNWLQIYVVGAVNSRTYFDLENGVLGGYKLNVINRSIENIGNGWYRCRMSFNSSNTSIARIFPSDGNNDDTGTNGSIYIQDAQLEQGLVATDYIETTTAPLRAGLLEDEPRFDYHNSASSSPNTCPSLLLEPSRTNFIPNSEYLTGASQITSQINNSLSPEGKTNATLIQATGTTVQPRYAESVTTTSGENILSVFAKSGNNDFIALGFQSYTGGSGTSFSFFDLANGTTPTAGAKIENYGNGWYRCISPPYTVDAGDTSGINTVFLTPSTSSLNFSTAAESNGKNVSIYGFQLEQGSYATSYIPTYGASATRGQETMGINTLDQVYSTDITLFLEVERLVSTSDINEEIGIVLNSTTSPTNRVTFYSTSNGRLRVLISDNTGTTDNLYSAVNAFEKGETIKIALKITNSGCTLFIDGSSVDTSSGIGEILGIDRISFIRDSIIKQYLMLPEALSDTDCEILTGATTYSSFAAMASALNYTVYE